MAGTYGIQISCEIINEFTLRFGKSVDPTPIIEEVLKDFLERTEGDGHVWGSYHVAKRERERRMKEQLDEMLDPGPRTEGYRWKSVFLPNGTLLRMHYNDAYHHAQIVHSELVYDGNPMSPSQFASTVANGTSRNAWRDVSVQLPGEEIWRPAQELRWKKSTS